jgi:hypothetical protein
VKYANYLYETRYVALSSIDPRETTSHLTAPHRARVNQQRQSDKTKPNQNQKQNMKSNRRHSSADETNGPIDHGSITLP